MRTSRWRSPTAATCCRPVASCSRGQRPSSASTRICARPTSGARPTRLGGMDERVAVATVVATRSSAPRPVGSKLFVRDDGSIEGSVSNGCVENDVILAAQEVLAGGEPRLITYGITDEMAFGVGLPCGGEIDVFVEPDRSDQADVVLTVVAGDEIGEKLHDPDLEQAARRRGR